MHNIKIIMNININLNLNTNANIKMVINNLVVDIGVKIDNTSDSGPSSTVTSITAVAKTIATASTRQAENKRISKHRARKQ